jgi:cation:H+ antiporter
MLTLPVALVGFVAAAAVVAAAGVALTVRAEHLARVTGLGQAIMGAVFIGITTSLAGTVTSATAAFLGSAALAASNSIGGIAAQTVFLALADMVYRKANLEHAAASEANLQQSALLIVMLSIPLIGFALPELTIGWVHPVSPLLVVVYLSGVHLVNRAFREPMWRPRLTRETEQEPPRDRSGQRATARDWLGFLALAAVVAVAGWVIAECGVALSARLGLRESLVGGVFTSVSTSLPELVVALTAVRRGALTLAVGDILGGNTFDVLFLALADLCYLEGSLYAAVGRGELLWLAVSLLMAGTLLMGLLRRERFGFANIGFESALVLAIYVVAVTVLALSP